MHHIDHTTPHSSIDRADLSPRKKRSASNSQESLTENFKKMHCNSDEIATFLFGGSCVDTPVEMKKESMQKIFKRSTELSPREPFTRHRANDICTSSSSSSEMSTNEIVSFSAKIDPAPTENRTWIGQEKLEESKYSLRLSKSAMEGHSGEEISSLCKVEIENRTPRKISASAKSMHVGALRKNGLPSKDPLQCSLVSFELGKTILHPKNEDTKLIARIEKYIQNGIHKPHTCGEEMWRSMGCIKLYDSESKLLLDGSTLNQNDEKARYLAISRQMCNLLNRFFQHLTGSKELLIYASDFCQDQEGAKKLGELIASMLEKKGVDKNLAMTMKLLLGLGKQELYTHPANWAIPSEFQTVGGSDDIVVSQFNHLFEEVMEDLEYDKKISIKLCKEGGLIYKLEQPITFKEKNGTPLGTCRVHTTILFDKEMNCSSLQQEVKAAAVLEK